MSNECGIIILTLFKYYSVQSKCILCFHEIVVDRLKKQSSETEIDNVDRYSVIIISHVYLMCN